MKKLFAIGICALLVVVGLIYVAIFSSEAYASWRSVGPGGGGWLVDVEYSPGRNELFAALDCGGVRISRNSGATWEIPNQSFGAYYGSEVEDVAIHPKNAKWIFLTAWTGIYRSTDAGKTWSSVLSVGDGTGLRVNTIGFDPDNVNVIYAGSGTTKNSLGFINVEGNTDAQGVLWRSLDAGVTWKELYRFDQRMSVYSVIVDGKKTSKSEDNRIMLSTNKGLWRSDDGGRRFARITNGIPENLRQAVASPTNRNLLWATAMYDGVYRSYDFGASWLHIGPNDKRAYVYITVDPARSGPNANTIAVSYHDYHDHGGVLIANGSTPRVSWKIVFPNNQIERAWETAEGPVAGAFKIGYPKGRRTFYLIVPGSRLYTSIDMGRTWQFVHTKKIGNDWRGEGFELMILADGVIDPRDGTIYASYIDMGTFKSLDNGLTWKQLTAGGHFAGGNPETVAVDPRTGEVFVSVESGKTLSSTNSGWNFSETFSKKANHIAFGNDGSVYVATDDGVFVRSNGQWNQTGDIRSVKAVVSSIGMVYAATDQGVWKLETPTLGRSGQAGQWNLVFGLSGIIPGGLVVDTMGNRLLAATGTTVHQWDGQKLTARYSANDLQSLKNNGSTVYVKSRTKGLWRSTDFGTTWKDVTEGVYQDGYERGLIVDPKNPNIVYYGSKCMGVFKREIK